MRMRGSGQRKRSQVKPPYHSLGSTLGLSAHTRSPVPWPTPRSTPAHSLYASGRCCGSCAPMPGRDGARVGARGSTGGWVGGGAVMMTVRRVGRWVAAVEARAAGSFTGTRETIRAARMPHGQLDSACPRHVQNGPCTVEPSLRRRRRDSALLYTALGGANPVGMPCGASPRSRRGCMFGNGYAS